MKRLLIGLFAAGVALSISAFTTIKPKQGFTMYYYVLTYQGIYQKVNYIPDPGNCMDTATSKCYLGYTTNQGNSFSSESIPASPFVQSLSNGLYMP